MRSDIKNPMRQSHMSSSAAPIESPRKPATARLFVSVPLTPTEAIRAILPRIEALGQAVRVSDPAQFHLTLRFLGDQPIDSIPAIAQALRDVAEDCQAVQCHVRGLDLLPDRKRPRVLYAGLEPVDRVSALADRLNALLIEAGFPPPDRPFMPHLTVARIKAHPPDALFRLLDQHRQADFGNMGLDRITLFKSELDPAGAVHTELDHVLLPEPARS